MNWYLITIVIILLIFGFYCHYYSYKKINNNWEILQVDDPSKDKYEELMIQKSPTIITGVIEKWDGINQIDPQYIIETKNKYIIHADVKKLLDKYTGFYDLTLSISKKYSSYYDKADATTSIVLQENHRHLMCQLYGKRKIILFSPDQADFLYPTRDNSPKNKNKTLNKSKVDFWNPDYKEYPKFNDSKYLEIILSPGQILYIPYGWWWCSINIYESITLNVLSQPLFS